MEKATVKSACWESERKFMLSHEKKKKKEKAEGLGSLCVHAEVLVLVRTYPLFRPRCLSL